ncbi:MAG: hypothetical protein JXA71_17850 [Chitinispirillaceae bacterium]|nr:hypothetical protein [Chitinispirillaceae bacterium]
MQKLNIHQNAARAGEKGSILVSAIAMSMIIALAGFSFMQITTSSFNNATEAIKNEQAFNAAESGVWMAARWLRNPANFPQLNPRSDLAYPFGTLPIDPSINTMDVYVSVQFSPGPLASITSAVYRDPSGGQLKTAATFKKQIAIGNIHVQSFGTYSNFYNTYQPDYTHYVTGQWKQFPTIADWGGFYNRTFNGRFHMNNCFLKLSDGAKPGGAGPVTFTNGLVTVATPTDPTIIANYTKNYGISPTTGHNYNAGVWADWTTEVTPDKLDQIFHDRYTSNVAQIALPAGELNATAILADPSISNKIRLPPSGYVTDDEGEEATNYRPTLILNGTSATYQFKQGTTLRTRTYNIDGQIFCSTANLNVYGVTTGRVTITTAPGKSIVPVGNIVTSDYNPATGSLNNPNNIDNIIGLAPGKHIRFNNSWKKYFRYDPAPVIQNVSDRITNNTTMHISASIIATGTANVSYATNAARTTFTTRTEMGCEYWDLCTPVLYNYNLFGNRILGGYRPAASGWHGIVNGGCNGTQSIAYDNRMLNFGLQPPAYPRQTTTSGLWVLRISGWSERNTI